MLNIGLFTFNDFQENTYLITNEKKQCWVVDPGMYYQRETNQFISYLETNQLQPQAIINTHAHLDHVFGVQPLIDKYKVPFGLHKEELVVLEHAATSAAMFGLNFTKIPKPSFFINEGVPLMLGEDEIKVLFCPGHSVGSIVFYYKKGNWAIVGDVLFAGSIGRTDLPGGNFETLINSIQNNLFHLPKETVVYPGHGGNTTIGEEMANNPFCRVG